MAVKFKDYYKTLGVERSATQEDIKQAFRKLARVHHPDVAKNKAAGEAKFKEVNEAYEVLGDSEKRQRYDELGANWQDAGGGQDGQETYGRGRASWSRRGPGFEFGGTGFSDFFESFFGSRREGFGAYREPAQPEGDFVQPGRDVKADIMVTLEEALRGSLRKVALRRTGARCGRSWPGPRLSGPGRCHERSPPLGEPHSHAGPRARFRASGRRRCEGTPGIAIGCGVFPRGSPRLRPCSRRFTSSATARQAGQVRAGTRGEPRSR